MFPIYFSALLKAEDGRITEPGEACVSRTENKVTFKSDFVPLVKLDTIVEIVRVLGETEFERFIGKVYLSSRNLLQIIAVDEQVMGAARELFDINTYLPAYFALSPNNSPRFNARKAELVAGTIRYLSMDMVKVSAMPYIGEGQCMMVDCDTPLVLKSTVLRVKKRVLLGRKAAILICAIVVLPPLEKEALSNHVALLNKQEEDVDLDTIPPDEWVAEDWSAGDLSANDWTL